MRIATWNCCRGPYAVKTAAIATVAADIAVLQECPRPVAESDQCLWFGDNPRSGLAILASGDFRLRRLRAKRNVPNYTVPVAVSGPAQFTLLGVWTKPNPDYRYVEAVVRAVHLYRHQIASTPTVLLGDLNSNRFWDKSHPVDANHSALVRKLSALGLESCYHAHFNEAQGDETRPTFYFQWKSAKPYHIDYCFVPRAWVGAIARVEIGSYEFWKGYSDHRPLTVEFDRARLPAAR
jgi:hypothetical protein